MAASRQVTLKLLCMGDSAVGKSNLLMRYTDDKFAQDYIATIGVDFKLKTITVNGRSIRIQLWDTAGQERFRTLAQAYYRGAHGVFLVYDVTNERSFNNVQRWADDVDRQTAGADGPILKMLVGNKCDLVAERTVDTARGQQLARELGISFFETSAKEGINVDAAFEALIMDVYAKSYGALGGAPTTVGGVVKLAAAERTKAAANAAGAAKPSECCS